MTEPTFEQKTETLGGVLSLVMKDPEAGSIVATVLGGFGADARRAIITTFIEGKAAADRFHASLEPAAPEADNSLSPRHTYATAEEAAAYAQGVADAENRHSEITALEALTGEDKS